MFCVALVITLFAKNGGNTPKFYPVGTSVPASNLYRGTGYPG
jgi:hypothetical protein